MKNIVKHIVLSIIVMLPFVIGSTAFAQSKANVENVDFNLEGENLVITYDISKVKSGETFNVSVNITTASGSKINAFALSGDIGPGVYGGKYKRIVWDLVKDNVYIDDEIAVEVIATSEITSKPVSVGGALLRSLVLPGWGNMYAKGGGAYWLMGVVGYGAVAGAVMMNNKAYNTYEDYKNSDVPSERDQLYNDADQYYKNQKVLMLGAAAIWAVDLIWTGIQAGNVNARARNSKVSMGYYYNPVVRQPMFTLTYKFN
nr:hypothetical protein [Bacteroidota bacterium]